MGIFLFLLKIGARRQIRYEFNTREFIENLNMMAGSRQKNLAHPDTLAYLCGNIAPEELSKLKAKMIRRLIRMRMLESDRLLGRYYTIAIDMTGHINFGNKRHCERCLVQQKDSGRHIYYHPVLEAKLVTSRGLALSICTEFVENEGGYKKQDSELRAFSRLAEKIKGLFPQMEICLLLDALYANQQVVGLCESNRWKYVITFKKGSMPATYAEAMTIKDLQKQNRGRHEDDGVSQEYAWASNVDHEDHLLNVLECTEKKLHSQKTKRYAWATNIEITYKNHKEIANGAGRLRWKIENEGFNTQKNGGYGLKHIYSSNPTAMKNFYHLLQIAHIINQLMEKGGLLKECIKKVFGGIRNFTRRLLEHLRATVITAERLQLITATSFQIRFDTS